MAQTLGLLSFLIFLIADSILVNIGVLPTETSKIAKSFEAHEVVPDVIPKAPDAVAYVQYSEGVYVNEGNVLTPTLAKHKPIVVWDADPNEFYTLVMTDPDAPSRADPKFREWQHWLVGNVPGNNVSVGVVLSEYIGPAPPLDTGLHRYVFLVYRQPYNLNFDEPRLTNSSTVSRTPFSIVDFAQKYNLGDPVAGNFYQAAYDDYVPELSKLLGL